MHRTRKISKPFELTSDMTEIALMAFASPELVERRFAELFGGEPAKGTTTSPQDATGALIDTVS